VEDVSGGWSVSSVVSSACVAAPAPLLLRVLDPGDAVVHVFHSLFSCCHLQVPVSSFVYREERMEKGKEEIKR
jgi:hypothetical protein